MILYCNGEPRARVVLDAIVKRQALLGLEGDPGKTGKDESAPRVSAACLGAWFVLVVSFFAVFLFLGNRGIAGVS